MILFEKTEVVGLEPAIRGMRNPMNSWDKSDSEWKLESWHDTNGGTYEVGENDHKLMMSLAKNGSVHAKYRRMIVVYVDITAPLYWWKEMDQNRVGVVTNSCSTMHKIHAKEFVLEDFSCEHLFEEESGWIEDENKCLWCSAPTCLETTVKILNAYRYQYLKTKDKKYWYSMIQLLPSSYNQKRTIMLNYEVLANIYKSRQNHKLDEWREFCKWIEGLPYSEIITGNENIIEG